jgi:hypothetical protein
LDHQGVVDPHPRLAGASGTDPEGFAARDQRHWAAGTTRPTVEVRQRVSCAEVVAMTVHEPTDRRGLRVIAYDECLWLLRRATMGRLGFVHHGEPEILPVTFGMDGPAPVFRTTWGSKFDAAAAGGLVTLEADSLDPVHGRAWSVVVKGTAAVEYADADIARLEALGVPVWLRDDSETFWVRIRPEDTTGRELRLP